MRNFFIFILILGSLALGVFFYLKQKADIHHTSARVAWKNLAIKHITDDLNDAARLKETLTDSQEWFSSKMILCRDGSWLVYRAQCHKEDPKIHDIFIAKASDDKWYYSDFHFCKKMMVLESAEQPESLDTLSQEYFIVEFDGKSDEALNPTWITN